MGKSPVGKRPTPRVTKDHSPSYDTSSGRTKGVSNTKSPTGKRPTPKVAKNSPKIPGAPSAPHYPKQTSMPAPKQKWGKRGGGKAHGGN